MIEVMVVAAIVAILAAIALPNYNEYVRRGQRANARVALLQAAHWMERAATTSGTYPLCNTTACAIPGTLLVVEGGQYTVSAASTNSTWTITATRVSTSGQANDRCGDFKLDQAGNKTNDNKAAGVTDADCWGR